MKKHFVRYNKVADRVEAFSGRTRPKGNGWTEVPFNFCDCGVPVPLLGTGNSQACEDEGVVPHNDVIMTDDGGNIHLEFTGGNAAANVAFYIHIFRPSPFVPGNLSEVDGLPPGTTEVTTGFETTVNVCDQVEVFFKADCETLWHHVIVKEGQHCGE